MKFSEIIEKLGSSVVAHSLTMHSDNDPEITGVAAIDEATPSTISYAESNKFAVLAGSTAASALILPANEDLQAKAEARGVAWVSVRQPRLAFAQTIALYYHPFKPAPVIHPTAVIDPSVELGESVSIGANVVIQSGAKMGRVL